MINIITKHRYWGWPWMPGRPGFPCEILIYIILNPSTTMQLDLAIVAWLFTAVVAASNDTIGHRELIGGAGSGVGCDWPIDLSLERDGGYSGDRTAVEAAGGGYRGRTGNAIISYLVSRLAAAAQGGFAVPWSGLLRVELSGHSGSKGGVQPSPESMAVWGPRFGKLSVCFKESGHPFPCPKASASASVPSNRLPPSVAAQKCPSDDAKFRQVIIISDDGGNFRQVVCDEMAASSLAQSCACTLGCRGSLHRPSLRLY
jgi:hypothetical protein